MTLKRIASLGDVVTIDRSVVDPNEIDDGTLYIGLENIESGGRLRGVASVNHGDLASSKFVFSRDHVLYGRLRPYLAKVARPNFDGVCSTDILPLRPGSDVDRSYLAWWLLSPPVLSLAASRATGANLPRVSSRILSQFQIPLPSLLEQRRIACILDKAEALRAKRRAALAHLDALTQSIFLDMFGDPGSNPKKWPVRRLSEVFEIARGGSPRPIDEFVTDAADGINWITIGDATEKFIRATKRRIKPEGALRSRFVKEGDFLLTNSMSFGRPYILKTSGCIHDGWLVLSPRVADTESEYFYRLLSSDAVYAEFARRAPGATVKNLNIDLVRNVLVPVAPTSLQREFARKVALADELKGRHAESMVALDALFGSLQHRAFRGEL